MSCAWYLVLTLLLQVAGDTTADWPYGVYALLKPIAGCTTGWHDKGWIFQDTENTNPSNNRSETLHIDGHVSQSYVIRSFCIKKNAGSRRTTWPDGAYCTYKRKGDSTSSIDGWIEMEDEKTSNKDRLIFYSNLYQIDYDAGQHFLQLRFNCKISENKKKIPISLPITKPFYLLPYGSRDCQQVKWMVATSEWIKYHTGNYNGYYSYFQKSWRAPYHEIGDFYDKGITMFYCYYEGCNHTLNDTKGAFQSPEFLGKYPNGQLCSWRIMVPDNHTLVVNFTKFSLCEYDKDTLQLYEYDSRVFKPKQAYFGHQQPFTITATRDVMFVFRSDEENNSTGFRAEYEIFKTSERTTTTKPPTTTANPTTTKPTTKLITTQPPTTKRPTTKLPTTTEAATTFPPTTNVNSKTNETVQCNPNPTKDKSHNKSYDQSPKKTWFSDETWRIVVMVIPLAVFILIALVIIDIFCRYRYKKASKSGPAVSSADDGMVVNPTYERGNIILDQSTDTVTNETTVADQPQSHDEPPDYEDVDYTQLNEIPPPRRSTKRQECYALQPVGNDNSSVFYCVLEPPKTESDHSQSQVPEPVGNSAPEVFYHTLEPPTASNKPTYQNLSEVNHFTLNPVYESAENSAPLVEANKLYDNYIA